MNSSKFFKSEGNKVFDVNSAPMFVDKLMSELKAPYVRAYYSTLGGNENVAIMLTISKDAKENWDSKILENSTYGKFRIDNKGSVELFSGTLPKMRKFTAKSQSDIIEKLNKYLVYGNGAKSKFDDGGNINDIQADYYSASEACISLNTLVPQSMASEQKRFNQTLKSFIERKYGMSVDEYVADRLKYNSVDELCYDPIKLDDAGNRLTRFSREQIDAIATAIYNHEENGDSIIIADQTGVGKGRTASGLIRYGIMSLGVKPIFVTEKAHLVNDIFRDLVDIGFDAGIPKKKFDQSDALMKEDWTDKELTKIIINDLKDNDDFRFDLPVDIGDFDVTKLVAIDKIDSQNADFDKANEIMESAIETYRQNFIQEGYKEYVYKDVTKFDYDKRVEEAIRQNKMLVKPFFLNNIDIYDKERNLLYPKISNDELRKVIGYIYDDKNKRTYVDSDEHYEKVAEEFYKTDYKFIAMTYTQLNRMLETGQDHSQGLKLNAKIRFLNEVAKNNVLILDESHTSAGSDSNTFTTFANIIQNSAMTTFLSATYAKRPDNMPIYAISTSIKETGLAKKELVDVFKAGGTAIQEAVSSELTKNGQLLRREKRIEGNSEYYYSKNETEDKIGTMQAQRLNQIAEHLVVIREFSKKFRKLVKQIGMRFNTDEHKVISNVLSVNADMFRLFNFFLLGIKVKQTTEFAIKRLDNGVKPIITIANTLESALNNMSKTFLTSDESNKYNVGDVIENDFKLYLAYLLSRVFKIKYTKVEGDEPVTIFLGDIMFGGYEVSEDEKALKTLIEELYIEKYDSKYQSAINGILMLKTGVGIAPLDEIKSRIEEAGYSIDEITGRSLCVKFENNDYTKGVIEKRKKTNTTSLVNLYNTNEVDALLINQSGAVGISMHARPVGRAKEFYEVRKEKVVIDGNEKEVEVGFPTSLKNKNEVKKRCMIITQMELDINKEVQKLGRINRTGQVYSGDYTYIISSIPSETRISAMMERKLRSLSANVSSNQEQASYLFSGDDFFTEDAKKPFNETLKKLMFDSRFQDYRTSDYIIPDDKTGEEVVTKIKDFSKKLYFDNYDYQLEFYRIFSEEYKKFQQTEEFVGTVAVKDYKANVLEKFPFYIGDENAKTSFGRHTFLEKTTVRDFIPKTTEGDITTLIAQKLNVTNSKGDTNKFNTVASYKSAVKKSLDEWFKNEYSNNIEETIKRDEQLLGDTKKLLSEKEEELKAYGKISEILQTEEDVKNAKIKTAEIQQNVTELMSSGNIAEATQKLAELQDAQSNQKKLEQKLESYGDYSLMKSQARVVKSEVNNLTARVEKIESTIASNKEFIEDRKNTINLIKDYVDKIGYVYKLNHYTQLVNTSVDSETGEETEHYTYSQSYSNQSVLYGVSYNLTNMVPSNVTLYFADITENKQVTLSKLNTNFSEKEVAKGKRAEYELESIINTNYINYWNENVVKTTDTGINKTKYFLVGGILKTYSLMRSLELNGKITKYTTSENQEKLGIEIADSLKPGSQTERIYDDLERAYNSSADSVYSIVYKGTKQNVDALIIRYAFNYVKGFRELAEEKLFDEISIKYSILNRGVGMELQKTRFSASESASFAFQMPVGISNTYITIHLSGDLKTLLKEIYNSAYYLTNNFDEDDYNDLIEKCNVLTDEDYFYRNIKLRINLTDNNQIQDFIDIIKLATDNKSFDFIYTKDSTGIARKLDPDGFLNIYKAENNSSQPGRISASRQNFGVLAFLSSIDTYAEIKSSIELSYESFNEFIDFAESNNAQPNLITSNVAFNQNSSMFVLESFKDEVVEAKTDKYDNTYFDTTIEGSNEDILNAMIEDLYNTIIK